jgi:hypothetical protein
VDAGDKHGMTLAFKNANAGEIALPGVRDIGRSDLQTALL